MEGKTAIQFLAKDEDAKVIRDAAESRRQSIASFVYYHTLEAARAVIGQNKASK